MLQKKKKIRHCDFSLRKRQADQVHFPSKQGCCGKARSKRMHMWCKIAFWLLPVYSVNNRNKVLHVARAKDISPSHFSLVSVVSSSFSFLPAIGTSQREPWYSWLSFFFKVGSSEKQLSCNLKLLNLSKMSSLPPQSRHISYPISIYKTLKTDWYRISSSTFISGFAVTYWAYSSDFCFCYLVFFIWTDYFSFFFISWSGTICWDFFL